MVVLGRVCLLSLQDSGICMNERQVASLITLVARTHAGLNKDTSDLHDVATSLGGAATDSTGR